MNNYRIGRSFSLLLIPVFSLFLISGCASKLPANALQLSPESLKIKQLQTRTFDTDDEKKLLSASAAVLQDLGFNISESETKLGLISASKQRTAVETGQVVGAIFLSVLTKQPVHYDKEQSIRVCLVTRPVGEKNKSITVRVTFQRLVINTANQVTKREAVIEEDIYREFFEKLSQSVFLEAHNI